MSRRNLKAIPAWFLVLIPTSARADKLLYAYEGDVLPQQAGWDVYDPCNPNYCTESINNGHFVLSWAPLLGDYVNYRYLVAGVEADMPPNLWAEARFRSNRSHESLIDWATDGRFRAHYRGASNTLYLLGDAVTDGGSMTGLPLDEFYTVRYETLDGIDSWFSLDGVVFASWYYQIDDNHASTLQIRGRGGPNGPPPGFAKNEWDFVRYGVITFGERIVAADPPAGFLDPVVWSGCDRFTVTFDAPNFMYVNQVTVSSTGGVTPAVKWVKRLDNGPPEVLEIVLDRTLPPHERTTFTFTDVDPGNPNHPTINTVAYTFQRGDIDADGDWDLHDFAASQNCFGCSECLQAPEWRCRAFDLHPENELVRINLDDHAAFLEILTGPGM